MKEIELKSLPKIGPCYRKLIFGKRSGIPKDGKLPEIRYTVKGIKPEPDHLQSFGSLCKTEISENLPINYPYALAGPLHLALISDESFPIKAAGLLHLRNSIEYHDSILTSETFDLSVETSESRFRPQGFEFEAVTKIEVEGQLKWVCKSTFLKRGKFEKEDPASEDENIFEKLELGTDTINFPVPGNAGRLYAKVCKDYNPIHIATPLAWLFGMKKSIAHGMWVSSRALGEMKDLQNVKKLDLAFKGPVYNGGTVSIIRKGDFFNLFYQGNNRPVILGKFEV